MYKRFIVIGLLFALIVNVGVIAAQDEPQPGTPEENECNPGGVLYRAENQDGCPTEWYWKAGWYLAAFNNGRLSREDFPDEYASVLPPPLPPALVEPPSPPVTFDDDGVFTL